MTHININIPNLLEPAFEVPKFGAIELPVFLQRIYIKLRLKVLEKRLENTLKKLDVIILSLEGTYNHLKTVNAETALQIGKDARDCSQELIEAHGGYNKVKELKNEDPEFAYRLKSILKWLNKIEARAHKIAYKDAPKIKTDKDLIDGVQYMNARYLNNNAI